MRQIFFCFVISCIILGCGTNEKRHQSKATHKRVSSMLDTSIRNLLQLRNPAATPDSIKKQINDDSALVFMTKDEMEYLIAYPDPQQALGTFIGFELSGISSKFNGYPIIKTDIERFTTSSGINKKTSVEEVLKAKGEPTSTNSSNGITIYQFKRPHHNNGNEMYIFELEEVDRRITRIRFGFIPAEPVAQPLPVPQKLKRLR